MGVVFAKWRLLVVDLEWSPQKPDRRATQRDEAAIKEWKRTQWPQIKKNQYDLWTMKRQAL